MERKYIKKDRATIEGEHLKRKIENMKNFKKNSTKEEYVAWLKEEIEEWENKLNFISFLLELFDGINLDKSEDYWSYQRVLTMASIAKTDRIHIESALEILKRELHTLDDSDD